MKIVVRKAFCVKLALAFVLCFLGVGCAFAEGCLARSHKLSTLRTEAKGLCQPQGCCCEAKESLCNVSKNCYAGLPEFALFAVPRVKHSTPAQITVNTTCISSLLDFPTGLDSTVWTLAVRPFVPLFLLNLSLLC